jgi:hypothetical protein
VAEVVVPVTTEAVVVVEVVVVAEEDVVTLAIVAKFPDDQVQLFG